MQRDPERLDLGFVLLVAQTSGRRTPRAIEPLARVLEAAGGVILELLGRRLMVE